ncbi:MAG: endonuclease, partial [Opitutales bacterium]
SSSSFDTWDALQVIDADPNDSSKVITVYANCSLDANARTGSGTDAGGCACGGGPTSWNREHTWPNTYGFPSSGSAPYTDLHQLRPSVESYNNDRGSKAYDDGGTQTLCVDGTTVVNRTDGDSFEVWDDRKGDIARAMFYMAVRYEGTFGEPDLELTDSAFSPGQSRMGKLSTLLQWHAADPVDNAERARNQRVYSFQDNRNPFVDHPEWVASIFGGGVTPVLTLSLNDTAIAEGDGVSATFATVTRNTGTATALEVSVSVSDTSEATADSTVTIPLNASSMTFAIDAVDDADADGDQTVTITVSAAGWTSDSAALTVTDDDTASSPPGGGDTVFISEYIEDGADKALELFNPSNTAADLTEYTLERYANGKTTVEGSPVQLSGTLAPGEVFLVVNPNSATELRNAADLLDQVAIAFNGDDVVVLRHNGEIVDIIGGPIGEREDWAEDVTLVRNSNILSGTPVYDANEWTDLGQGDFSNFGIHTVDAPVDEPPTVPEPAHTAALLAALALLLGFRRQRPAVINYR